MISIPGMVNLHRLILFKPHLFKNVLDTTCDQVTEGSTTKSNSHGEANLILIGTQRTQRPQFRMTKEKYFTRYLARV